MTEFALTPIVNSQGVGVGAAYRDEPGYNLTTYGPFPNWEEAREFCDLVNTRLGMDRQTADEIVASSMRGKVND